MCKHVRTIQIHLCSSSQSSEKNVKLEVLADGRLCMSTDQDPSTVKAICNTHGERNRSMDVQSGADQSPLDFSNPFALSHPGQNHCHHHNFGMDDDVLVGNLSPHSRASSQISSDMEAFSPLPAHTNIPTDTPLSSLSDESCRHFDHPSPNQSDLLSWPLGNAAQLSQSYQNHCNPMLFSSTMNPFSPEDSTLTNVSEWADFSMDFYLPPLPNYTDAPNLPSDASGQASSFSSPDRSLPTPSESAEKITSQNLDFASSANHTSPRGGNGFEPQIDARRGAKRMKKLDGLLQMLQTAALPELTEHNEIIKEVRQLYRNGSFQLKRMASGSCASDSEELAALSSPAKFVYDLLSWEKYRQEEKRLMREEDLSSISASKEVNARMMKARRRHSKTRDWASDGRKAAKMFFDALHNRDPADRSFALLLLASNVSLDQMLKIAHFPALRSSFAHRFARIVEKRAEGWSQMPSAGFTILNIAQTISD